MLWLVMVFSTKPLTKPKFYATWCQSRITRDQYRLSLEGTFCDTVQVLSGDGDMQLI